MTAPDPIVRQRIEDCQGLVRSLALGISRKLPPTVELEDLIAYGQVGLGEAARDFDPSRGSRFSTYAYYRIRGAIYDGLSKMAWFEHGHVGQVRYDQMSEEVLRLGSEDNPPTDAASLKSDACWFREVSRTLAVVYVASRGGGEQGEEMSSSAAMIDPSSPDAADVAMNREISERLHAVIDALPPVAARLIKGVYFEGLTLQEAGQRMGVSKSWASRLHSRALQQLAHLLRGVESSEERNEYSG